MPKLLALLLILTLQSKSIETREQDPSTSTKQQNFNQEFANRSEKNLNEHPEIDEMLAELMAELKQKANARQINAEKQAHAKSDPDSSKNSCICFTCKLQRKRRFSSHPNSSSEEIIKRYEKKLLKIVEEVLQTPDFTYVTDINEIMRIVENHKNEPEKQQTAVENNEPSKN